MAKRDIKTTDIKVFLGIGILGIVALIVLPIIAIGYFFQKEMSALDACQASGKTVEECEGGPITEFIRGSIEGEGMYAPEDIEPVPSSGLGGEGSVCGGADRLPCKPGLKCLAYGGEDMGVCMKDVVARYEGGSQQLGAACGRLGPDCVQNAFCGLASGSDEGTCKPSGTGSPKVMSLKIPAAAFENTGIYSLAAGEDATIEVQAVNAEKGQIELLAADEDPTDPETRPEVLGALTTSKTDVFTGEFALPTGFSGSLLVRLFSKDGQVTVMGVNVAAK